MMTHDVGVFNAMDRAASTTAPDVSQWFTSWHILLYNWPCQSPGPHVTPNRSSVAGCPEYLLARAVYTCSLHPHFSIIHVSSLSMQHLVVSVCNVTKFGQSLRGSNTFACCYIVVMNERGRALVD